MLEELTRAKKATGPAKRWRNRYRVREAFISLADFKYQPVGSVYWGAGVWPSKDVAESMRKPRTERGADEWLGAFPEETPK